LRGLDVREDADCLNATHVAEISVSLVARQHRALVEEGNAWDSFQQRVAAL
jgi:hypothetical protein